MQEMQETQVPSLYWVDPWRRKWQLSPVFLPEKFHGQRSLVGYNPWSHRESDTAEQLSILINKIWNFSKIMIKGNSNVLLRGGNKYRLKGKRYLHIKIELLLNRCTEILSRYLYFRIMQRRRILLKFITYNSVK